MGLASSSEDKDDEFSYSVQASLAGAANKVMLGILNPVGSGRVVSVQKYSIYVPTSSGTVIVHWEARRSNSHSAGTILAITQRDTTDLGAVGVARSNPTVTNVSLIESRVVQINSFLSPMGYEFPLGGAPVKPLVLQPAEGFHLLLVTSNTSTFKVGLVWTERGL